MARILRRPRTPESSHRGIACAIWELTLSCNLRCTHCGSSAGTARPNELSTKECFSVCEQLAEAGCKDVALMGGEPFLRRDCFSVARCIRQLGMSVSFVSNGTVIDPYLNELERIEPRVVGVSLDGMKESHDQIRGPGTWEKTVHAIEALKSHGIQTTVITTVSKINFKDLPKIKRLILGKGVNWQIQTAMPFGNFRREQMLSEEEFYATAVFISKERIRNKFEDLPVVGAHCYGYYSEFLPGCHWDGCQAGLSSVGITSDGNIVGCLSMGNERFHEGNIRQRRLSEIWNDPDSFGYNRISEKMSPGENCRDCKHVSECGGGCNSVSYALTGKFHNNPYCFYSIEKKLGIR